MNPERFQRVMQIFQRACALQHGQRTAFLTLQCGEDRELLDEVRALLQHDEQPTRVMDESAVGGGMRLLAAEIARMDAAAGAPGGEAAARMPRQIGRYRILRKIGEGGMGVVYLAEQERPRRTVALKVIRPGMASRPMLRRFEYEAHILGRLHHPGIAQIYEAGTANVVMDEAHPGATVSQAFLAMEYIEGKPLHQYADERELSARERLELFVKVGHAVQHAHQKGIIHRDLKPSNILVNDEAAERCGDEAGRPRSESAGPEGEPRAGGPAPPRAPIVASPLRRSFASSAQPKILDFGVARATDSELQLTTVHTSVGQLIGTLPYMSPEQLAGEPEEIDTRSDVYSLGVILYLLLTRHLPYEVGSRSIPEAMRRIREEPPARLSSFNRVFRGDVETIVLKALEKDRTRRYQSAAELSSDIERFLAGEPIQAKRDSAFYMLRTQLRRYRGAVAAILLFVIALGFFGVVASVQSRQNRLLAESEHRAKMQALAALDRAENEKARADRTAERLAVELTVSNIERGRLFGRMGNIGTAEDLIWREHLCKPESRHTYWALWELYSRNTWLATIHTHPGDVPAVRFSPDGQLLAAGGRGGRIQLIGMRDWTMAAALEAHSDTVQALDFSPDGRLLASSACDGRILIWDVPRRQVVHEFDGYAAEVSTVAFSPDGEKLATGAYNIPVLRVWDVDSAAMLTSVETPRGNFRVAFSPDGERIAAAGQDQQIRVWPNMPGSPAPIAAFKPHSDSIGTIEFTGDGAQLVSASADRLIKVTDLATREIAGIFKAPNGTIREVRLSLDGRTLASGGWWSIDLWDFATRARRRSIHIHEGVQGFDFTLEGRYIAWGCSTGHVRVWEVSPASSVSLTDASLDRCGACLSPDGCTIATGGIDGFVRFWDARTGEPRGGFKAHDGRIRAVRFDPEGRRLATGAADRTARIWDVESRECLHTFDEHWTVTYASLDWSPDGEQIVYNTVGGGFRVVDSRAGDVEATVPPDRYEPISVRFSPDGQTLATVERTVGLRFWTRAGVLIRTIPPVASPWTIAFSPDGRRIAVGNWGWAIDVYDVATGRLVTQLKGHNGTVWCVEFHPRDPNFLVSTAADGTVRLWDIAESRCLLVLDEFDGWDGLSLSFSGDGAFLLASSATALTTLWDLAYYDRHIAGNLEYQIENLGPDLGARVQATRLRAWGDQVRSAAWPRLTPAAPR